MKKLLLCFIALTSTFITAQDLTSTIKAQPGASIRKYPNNSSDVLQKFSRITEVQAVDFDGTFFKVNFNSISGFLNEYWIEKDSSALRIVRKYNDKIKNERNAAAQKRALEQKAADDILLKKFGKTTYQKIKEQKYWIGMTEEMAELSLGYPDTRNRTVTASRIHVQWVYSNKYLYFENGKLVSFQD